MKKYAMFEVYLARNMADIEAGKEITSEVFFFEDASIRLVKARIAKDAEQLPDGEDLWIRNDEGRWIKKNPWRIKILEELDPDDVDFKAEPGTVKQVY